MGLGDNRKGIMRQIIIIIIFLIFCNPILARENINGIRYDYLLHYESACIGAIAIAGFNKNVFDIKEDYGLYSIGIPVMIVGILKELRDYRNNGNNLPKDSYKDFMFTVAGAISGKLLSYTF